MCRVAVYLDFYTVCSLHTNTWSSNLILQKLTRCCSRCNNGKPAKYLAVPSTIYYSMSIWRFYYLFNL